MEAGAAGVEVAAGATGLVLVGIIFVSFEFETAVVVVAAGAEDDAVVLDPVKEGTTVEKDAAVTVDDNAGGTTDGIAPAADGTEVEVGTTVPSPTCQYSVSPTFVIIPEPENPG